MGEETICLTSATFVLTSIKAVSVELSGSDKTDVRRENTDVRWVGFHPLAKGISKIAIQEIMNGKEQRLYF